MSNVAKTAPDGHNQNINGEQNGHQNQNSYEKALNEIREDMPTWKKNFLQKKNEEIMAEIRSRKEKEDIEQQKYANVPSWKVEIIKKKENEKKRKEELQRQKEEEKVKQENDFNMKPHWQKELIKRRNSYQANIP